MSYKDNREAAYRKEFSEYQYNLSPKKLAQDKTTANGEEIVTLDTADLIRLIAKQDEMIRILKQDVYCLRGQFEYIYKNGLDAYDSEIATIRNTYPKPD